MHNTKAETLKARKPHRCTSCGEAIAVGKQYARWVSFDDSAYTNKMHPECLAAHHADARKYGSSGGWEYQPYSYTRGEVDA